MADKDGRVLSVRLSGADVRKLKVIAGRVGVTESEVVRFALRHALARMSPLHDTGTHGATLLPVFVEFGTEMMSYFDLDEPALDRIINEDLDGGRRVEREDIGLLAMSALEENRLAARLAQVASGPIDSAGVRDALREYLYGKYLYRRSA